MLNRWIEDGLLDVLGEEGVGCIAFTALAQGLLTDRYLNGVPEDSRAAQGKSLDQDVINEENLARVRALNEIAERPRPDAWRSWRWPGCCATRG